LLAGAGVVAAKGAKAVPSPLNAAKTSTGPKHGTAAKMTDPAIPKRPGNLPPGGAGERYTRQVTTPKGSGLKSGNFPPGAAGQRYTPQTTMPKGIGPQPRAGERYTREAITPKGFGPKSGNFPPGAAGQRSMRQTTMPKGFGPQPPPRQGVGQARRPDQHGSVKKPDNR
jgi:hypothetical protein